MPGRLRQEDFHKESLASVANARPAWRMALGQCLKTKTKRKPGVMSWASLSLLKILKGKQKEESAGQKLKNQTQDLL